MEMKRMSKDVFLKYILDNRKDEFKDHGFEVFHSNPIDARGQASSFVIVNIATRNGNLYVGVAKCNPVDDEFSLEKGLAIACNRAWREMYAMPSLYAKNKGKRTSRRSAAITMGIQALLGSTRSKPFRARQGLIGLLRRGK